MSKSTTIAARKAALAGLKATGAILEEPTLILFKNNTGGVSKTTVIADLTECDFSGYAAVAALEFGTPYTDGANNVLMSAPSEQFTASGSTITNSVYGWALVNAAKTALYYAEMFDEPAIMNEAGDGLIVQPTIGYGW